MIPVEGESSAATQRSAGSSRCACLAVSHCKSSTPFARAVLATRSKTRDFAFFSGYDRLANLDMRDSMIAAIGVKALALGDAAACFQAAGRIIKPAMNHLAVARRGLERSYRRVQGQVHRAPPTREPAPSQARPPLHRSPRIRSRSRHPYPIGDRLRQLCTRAHGWCMNQFTHAVGSGSSKNRGLGLHRHR